MDLDFIKLVTIIDALLGMLDKEQISFDSMVEDAIKECKEESKEK